MLSTKLYILRNVLNDASSEKKMMKFIYFLLFLVAFTRAEDSTSETGSTEEVTEGSTVAEEGNTETESGEKTSTTSKSSLLYPEFFVLGAAAYFARLF